MGMEIFNRSQYPVGFGPNIKFNKPVKSLYFGQLPDDSFQITSYMRFCDENEIRKMIAQNPKIEQILSSYNIPINLNMKELEKLMKNHCPNTAEIAVEITKNLPPSLKQQVNVENLKEAALLHDFGKVLIPLEILNKKTALTADECDIINLHSELGYKLLKNTGINEDVLNLVRYHHRNCISSDTNVRNFVPDINLQVLNLADKYSALTEKRPYKEEFSPQKALTIIYSDVQNGNIHPFLFNALVHAVADNNFPQNCTKNVKKC